jgi:hypothetical protein
MNRKSWVLVFIAIALGAVYIIYFSGWFKPKLITISSTKRLGRIQFNLGADYKLTSVKVVPISALESNKYALPVWELKTDTNSAPTRFFSYGETIRGMKPIPGATPEPLEPGTNYRLLVEIGSRKGQHDFTP